MKIRNTLSELRQKRGQSAAELAAQIGVTRQTIYAMEAGNYVPNTVVALNLARVLGVKVEDLFLIDDEAPLPRRCADAVLIQNAQGAYEGQPVQLCQVGGKLVAACPEPLNWRLPPADGVLTGAGRPAKGSGKAKVQLFHAQKELGKRVLVAGCDPGISVLERHLQRAGIELVVVNCNSTRSLELLKQGLVHIAGIHLRDEATGESNLPAVRRMFDKRSVAVIGFAVWEEGIVVAAGNPKNIRGIADFARKNVAIVNREPGAGCRIMLDAQLARAGIEAKSVRGYDRIALGHLPAAWQIRSAKADCGIATKAAARVFGLDFIPLVSERYDFVLNKQTLNLPEVQELFDTLGRSNFRRELESLGGYDTSTAGSRFA